MECIKIGNTIRLLKDIWDSGGDCYPPGYIAYKGEVLVIRAISDFSTRVIGVSHEHRLDNYFWISSDEYTTELNVQTELF